MVVRTVSTGSNLSIGVVRPYNAQVRAIQEKVGKTCRVLDRAPHGAVISEKIRTSSVILKHEMYHFHVHLWWEIEIECDHNLPNIP